MQPRAALQATKSRHVAQCAQTTQIGQSHIAELTTLATLYREHSFVAYALTKFRRPHVESILSATSVQLM